MDRRVAKTRKQIVTAFFELLKKKSFEKITIQDIADKADINRGTVYLHFSDKYALMDYCIDSYVDELISQCGENEEIRLQREAFQRLFDYLGDHLETYQLLLANDRNNTFNKKLTATVEQQVAVAIKHMSKKQGPSQEMLIRFLVSGLLGVIDWWIRNYPACSSKEATDIMLELSTPYLS